MATDAELLRNYACDRCESAFTELARRHIDLVYSAALREVLGNASLAEDITQAVFTELARQASKLSRHPALAGWLYTCVRRMTANVRRAEDRRQRREREALTMNEPLSTNASDAVWRQLQPVLDDVMHELNETDRTAVVLRFFEEQSLKEVGLALGVTENAARMRVDRALERLQKLLTKRGVTSTASGSAAAIIAGAVVSAPSGLAANVVAGALAATAASTTTALTLLNLMTLTKLKAGVLAAVALAGAATPALMQHQTQVKLRTVNESLRLQAGQLAALRTENARLSHLLGEANSSQLSQDQLRELMKLRGEVGLLRRQTNELEKVRAENRRLQSWQANSKRSSESPENDPAVEQQKQMSYAKLNDAKALVLGMILYAEDNQDRLPATVDQFASYLTDNKPAESESPGLTGTNQFEIVYRGTRNEITHPASVIVIREKEAWLGPHGEWNRTYGFADGHSEVHKAPDGNFAPWEQQHMVSPAPPGE